MASAGILSWLEGIISVLWTALIMLVCDVGFKNAGLKISKKLNKFSLSWGCSYIHLDILPTSMICKEQHQVVAKDESCEMKISTKIFHFV